MNPETRLLEVENLRTSFFTKAGRIDAVDDVSYTINRGETLGIVGESGCGKSVASFSVMRLISEPGRITGGRIVFGDTDLASLPEAEMRKVRGDRIAMIFQEPMTAFNPVLTIGFQITEQIKAHRNVSHEEAKERAISLLKLVGIPSPEQRINEYPHQLSGGMRQRVMIAMALSCDPELLIADEPTTALDVTIQAQILDLMLELQEKLGMAIQFISHDLGVISEVSDRVLVMYAGKVVEKASTSDLFAHPRHPYTIGLMESIPRIDKDVEKLATIPGVVPSLLELPTGCRFQNRCPRASAQCRKQEPILEQVAEDHQVACFHPA